MIGHVIHCHGPLATCDLLLHCFVSHRDQLQVLGKGTGGGVWAYFGRRCSQTMLERMPYVYMLMINQQLIKHV